MKFPDLQLLSQDELKAESDRLKSVIADRKKKLDGEKDDDRKAFLEKVSVRRSEKLKAVQALIGSEESAGAKKK